MKARLALTLGLLMGLVMPFGMVEGQKQAPQPPKKALERGKGYVPLAPEKRKELQGENTRRHGQPIKRMALNTVNPPAFDCSSRGWVVPVWDQGQCGSCFLVSTVRTMTCTFVKNGWGKADGTFALAAQYGMDCHNFGGCNGGNGTEVVAWALKNGWYAETYIDQTGKTVKDYPAYSAREQQCRTVSGAKKWMVADWGFISQDGSFDVELMKTALNNFGPLNIALDAGGQFGNGTSTITSLGGSIDHEIMATAYDDNHDNGNGTKGAVLFSNQWGTDWGTNGYRWASYGACRNVVDWFWVSATPLAPVIVPPYKLFEGPMTAPVQVGLPNGYLDLPTAEANAKVIATADQKPVMIHDSLGAMVETIAPGPVPPIPPIPPTPPGPVGTVTLTLTPAQVQSVISQSGVIVINGQMTMTELTKAFAAAILQNPPTPPGTPTVTTITTTEPPMITVEPPTKNKK